MARHALRRSRGAAGARRKLAPLSQRHRRARPCPDEAIGSELFGRRAIRQGDWKAVNLSDAWRLFNIADDPGETNDLATREPARLKALVTAWDAYGKDTGVIMPSEPTRYP